jgi:hypothetical protein
MLRGDVLRSGRVGLGREEGGCELAVPGHTHPLIILDCHPELLLDLFPVAGTVPVGRVRLSVEVRVEDRVEYALVSRQPRFRHPNHRRFPLWRKRQVCVPTLRSSSEHGFQQEIGHRGPSGRSRAC